MVVDDSRVREPRAPENLPGYGFGILLWASVPVILVVAYFLRTFDLMSGVGCDGDCDYALMEAAYAAYPWAVGGSIALGIALHFVLRRAGRPTVWAAVVAVCLVVASWATTSGLYHLALAPMYERNDRLERGEFAEPELADPVGTWEVNRDGTAFLRFSSAGALSGSDGCHDLTGSWTQDSDGLIVIDDLAVEARDCNAIEPWLGEAESARLFEGLLYVNGAAGSPIGLLHAQD